MNIKKGDIFKVYQDGKITRTCIATNDMSGDECPIVSYRTIDNIREPWSSPIYISCVEGVICNIDDLEEIVGKAKLYDAICSISSVSISKI